MKKRGRLFKVLRNNDIALRIYTSFAFVLALTGILTGAIFMQLYQQNYIRSYANLLTKQGKSIARRVAKFDANKNVNLFQKYSIYIDEIENAEKTDIWIVSNASADKPLNEDYTNADTSDGTLTDEMYDVLDDAYNGEVSSSSSYDKVYGMMILRVAMPIRNKETKEVSGAVMMVSMIDKQTMGIDEGKYLITISVLLSFVISYIVAFGFSKYLSKPLAKIGHDVMRMAEGDYSAIDTKKPETQIGKLETSLDTLAGRLSTAERERENLEQVRRDFFANVSHELRTPITVMRGYAETLNDGVVSDADMIQEMYQRMLSECHGMERLVGDLFILSKMQNPDFEIEKEPVSLVQVFGDVSRSARIIGQEKHINFIEVFPEEDPCMMLGDYGRLRQMFMVIVDNAVKFSSVGGDICIRIWNEQNRLHVTIQDHGVGIAEEELPYIFEKFYKSKLKQNEKGTGLGLMIARQIALRHGGTIEVQSVKGEGSTFIFEFDECTTIDEYE